MLEYIIKNIYLFSTAALLAIGNFYDDPSDVFKEYRDKSLKVFITIRRLEKRMGLDLLVRAAYDLKKTESNFIILIYGKGIHEKYLRDLIIEFSNFVCFFLDFI